MSREDILNNLKEILIFVNKDKYENIELTEEKYLSTDLELTSYDMLSIIFIIEDKFGIEFTNISNYNQVKDVIDDILKLI